MSGEHQLRADGATPGSKLFEEDYCTNTRGEQPTELDCELHHRRCRDLSLQHAKHALSARILAP
jgi:hypothetical protein